MTERPHLPPPSRPPPRSPTKEAMTRNASVSAPPIPQSLSSVSSKQNSNSTAQCPASPPSSLCPPNRPAPSPPLRQSLSSSPPSPPPPAAPSNSFPLPFVSASPRSAAVAPSPSAPSPPAAAADSQPSVAAAPAASWLSSSSSRSISDDFVITGMTLGSGFSSTVKLACPLPHLHPSPFSQSEYAVKIISKQSANLDLIQFQQEIAVLRSIQHPHVVRLEAAYEDADSVWLVMQMAEGGELFERLLERGAGMTESEAQVILAQLLDALCYLHARGIVHRDLKPENLMFLHPPPKVVASTPSASPSLSPYSSSASESSCSAASSSPSSSPFAPSSSLYDHILLTDFGFATNLMTKPRALRARSQLGSTGYSAPEVFSGQPYTEACDVWSAGVVLHIMMTGLPPFVREEEGRQGLGDPFWLYCDEVRRGVEEGGGREVDTEGKRWAGRSDEVRALVRGMLQVDVARRLRAADARDSSWVREGRERWEAIKDWWKMKKAAASADSGGSAAGSAGLQGWTMRERGRSKEVGQMLSMKEVMTEMLLRAKEKEQDEKQHEAKEGAEDGVRELLPVQPVRPNRRIARPKAMSVVDTRSSARGD